MNPVFTFLLQDAFWTFVDQAIKPEQTPLFTRVFDGDPLADTVVHRFGISLEEAELEIAAARREVEL